MSFCCSCRTTERSTSQVCVSSRFRDIAHMADPATAYQIVPFPFSEVQSRLSSLLWAGLLPNFPKSPTPPPNPAVLYPTPPPTPPSDTHSASTAPPGPDPDPTTTVAGVSKSSRISESVRKELIFALPYEWTYTRYLMDLMREGENEDTPEYWKEVEEWRIERRRDTGLRKRSLGY